MDISLIKLVLLVVSPTPSLSPSLLSIFITILPLDMMWPSLVASTIFHQNPSEMTFNWNSTFQIGRQPFGWCWDFSNIGWFWLNSKTRARLLEKCHPIDGRYFELEDNGKPVWSYDVHLPCFPSSGSGFTWSRHCPWMEHFSGTCLDLIQCCPKFGSSLHRGIKRQWCYSWQCLIELCSSDWIHQEKNNSEMPSQVKGQPVKIMTRVTDQDPLSNGSMGLMRLENDAAPLPSSSTSFNLEIITTMMKIMIFIVSTSISWCMSHFARSCPPWLEPVGFVIFLRFAVWNLSGNHVAHLSNYFTREYPKANFHKSVLCYNFWWSVL